MSIVSSQFGSNLGAAIPSAAPAGGGDMLTPLAGAMQQNAAALGEAYKEVSIPQATGHQMGVPSSLMPRNNQAPQAAMNNSPVVGKHNAKMRGVGNAVTGVLNAISAVGTQLDNQKSMKVADATQKLMTLQNSIDQATQITPDAGAQAYAKAQLDIQRAKMSQQKILEDKSIHSALEKASVIDHTDPKKQDTPEHRGFFQGKAAFEAQQKKAAEAKAGSTPESKTPLADQFSASQPKTYGPNPMAQAKVQHLEAEQKFYQALYPKMLQQQSMDDRARLSRTAAAMRQLNAQVFDTQMQAVKAHQQDKNTAQSHTNRMSEIAAHGSENRKTLQALIEAKDTDPVAIMQFETRYTQEAATTEAKFNTDEIAATNAMRAAQAVNLGAGDPVAIKEAQTALAAVRAQRQNYQAEKDKTYNVIKNLKDFAANKGKGASNAGQPGTSSNSTTPVSGGGASDDPETLLHDLSGEGDGARGILPGGEEY